MAREAGGFRRNAFHQITVAHDAVSEVIHDLKSRPVVACREMGLRNRHADSIAKALAERPRGCLHSGRQLALGMAGRVAAPLAELLNLLKRQIIARKMKHAVE